MQLRPPVTVGGTAGLLHPVPVIMDTLFEINDVVLPPVDAVAQTVSPVAKVMELSVPVAALATLEIVPSVLVTPRLDFL